MVDVTPLLQMRKPRLREVRQLAQSRGAQRGHSRNGNAVELQDQSPETTGGVYNSPFESA